MLFLNLASNFAHAARYSEAAELVEEVRRNPDDPLPSGDDLLPDVSAPR